MNTNIHAIYISQPTNTCVEIAAVARYVRINPDLVIAECLDTEGNRESANVDHVQIKLTVSE